MLAERVDVVIGVDTHKHTHTAAAVAATTGAVLERSTVPTDPDGYVELVELADRHAALRAWAIEGTGTYGAALTRLLQQLRAKFKGQRSRTVTKTAARLRLRVDSDLGTRTYTTVLRDLARRRVALLAEAKTHEDAITAIVKSWRPDLLGQFGVGPIVAAIVVCAWSHPGRCRNGGAFAKLAGAAPIPASTGVTNKHRYNPFGDRQTVPAARPVALRRAIGPRG